MTQAQCSGCRWLHEGTPARFTRCLTCSRSKPDLFEPDFVRLDGKALSRTVTPMSMTSVGLRWCGTCKHSPDIRAELSTPRCSTCAKTAFYDEWEEAE